MTYVMSTIKPTIMGLRGLGEIKFGCKNGTCYAADGMGAKQGTDLLFRNLQASLNYFAGDAGFKPVSADGLIGSGTVAAAKKAVAYINANAPGPMVTRAIPLAALVQGSETMAAGAQVLYDGLQYFIKNWNLSPPILTPVPTQSPSTSVPGNLPMPPDLFPSSGGGGSTHWAWYLAGGLLAAGLVGGGFLLFTSPKKKGLPAI